VRQTAPQSVQTPFASPQLVHSQQVRVSPGRVFDSNCGVQELAEDALLAEESSLCEDSLLWEDSLLAEDALL
jgi:hypothetical protein